MNDLLLVVKRKWVTVLVIVIVFNMFSNSGEEARSIPHRISILLVGIDLFSIYNVVRANV